MNDIATTVVDDIAANIAEVRARIARAARSAGRSPDDITLVAVSKTHDVVHVEAAIRAGQLIFGENRVQEAVGKFQPLKAITPRVQLRLIGALQTNKARDAVRIADTIESLDRTRLVEALAEAVAREGRTPELMVQVNVGDEPQKAGVTRSEADRFIDFCRKQLGPAVTGLMCIPPADQDPAPHFAWLADCAGRHALQVLSMGMSADFEAAIAYGATHVRVGTAIFGRRARPGDR